MLNIIGGLSWTSVMWLAAASIVCNQSQAQTMLSSGTSQLAVLELYTSQGCSSCPPAERWLSSLKDQEELWTKVIPLAFHVDYWDYIGWKDQYAQARFGERQRRYAREGGVPTVYTPGMLLNGKAWRDWTRGRFPKTGNANAGELTLSLDDDKIKVRFSPPETSQMSLVVNIAWLGVDLKSDVLAGENRGRRLANDFVVLDLTELTMRQEPGVYTAQLNRSRPLSKAPRTAIVAWVASQTSLAPLQAVGGWLPDESGFAAAVGNW